MAESTNVNDKTVSEAQAEKNYASQVSSMSSLVTKMQSQTDKQIKSMDKRIDSVMRYQLATKKQSELLYKSSDKSIVANRELASSTSKILYSLNSSVKQLALGTKKITTMTANSSAHLIGQYSTAIKSDININKENTVAMALAQASPIFGYFASKFMETDVFQSAASKIKESMGRAIHDSMLAVKGVGQSLGDKIGDAFTRKEKIKLSQDSKRYLGAGTAADKVKQLKDSGKIKKAASGGYVKKDGYANVHAGEIITPNNQMTQMNESLKENLVLMRKMVLSPNSKDNRELMTEREENRQWQKDLLKATLDMRLSMVGMTSAIRVQWQRMLTEHPMFRTMRSTFDVMETAFVSPFKILFGMRGAYRRYLPKGKNAFQNMNSILGLIFTMFMPRLKSMDKNLININEAIGGKQAKKDSEQEWSVFGKFTDFLKARAKKEDKTVDSKSFMQKAMMAAKEALIEKGDLDRDALSDAHKMFFGKRRVKSVQDIKEFGQEAYKSAKQTATAAKDKVSDTAYNIKFDVEKYFKPELDKINASLKGTKKKLEDNEKYQALVNKVKKQKEQADDLAWKAQEAGSNILHDAEFKARGLAAKAKGNIPGVKRKAKDKAWDISEKAYAMKHDAEFKARALEIQAKNALSKRKGLQGLQEGSAEIKKSGMFFGHKGESVFPSSKLKSLTETLTRATENLKESALAMKVSLGSKWQAAKQHWADTDLPTSQYKNIAKTRWQRMRGYIGDKWGTARDSGLGKTTAKKLQSAKDATRRLLNYVFPDFETKLRKRIEKHEKRTVNLRTKWLNIFKKIRIKSLENTIKINKESIQLRKDYKKDLDGLQKRSIRMRVRADKQSESMIEKIRINGAKKIAKMRAKIFNQGIKEQNKITDQANKKVLKFQDKALSQMEKKQKKMYKRQRWVMRWVAWRQVRAEKKQLKEQEKIAKFQKKLENKRNKQLKKLNKLKNKVETQKQKFEAKIEAKKMKWQNKQEAAAAKMEAKVKLLEMKRKMKIQSIGAKVKAQKDKRLFKIQLKKDKLRMKRDLADMKAKTAEMKIQAKKEAKKLKEEIKQMKKEQWQERIKLMKQRIQYFKDTPRRLKEFKADKIAAFKQRKENAIKTAQAMKTQIFRLGGMFKTMNKYFPQMTKKLGSIYSVSKKFAGKVVSGIGGVMKKAGSGLWRGVMFVVSAIQGMMPMIGAALLAAAPAIGVAVAGAIAAKMAYGDIKKAREKAAEWGVSKGTAGVAGFLGGTKGGVGGATRGAAKGALIGATLGTVIPGAGTAIGGAIGAIAGGLLGALGGKNIAKFMSWYGNKIKSVVVGYYKFMTFPIRMAGKLVKGVYQDFKDAYGKDGFKGIIKEYVSKIKTWVTWPFKLMAQLGTFMRSSIIEIAASAAEKLPGGKIVAKYIRSKSPKDKKPEVNAVSKSSEFYTQLYKDSKKSRNVRKNKKWLQMSAKVNPHSRQYLNALQKKTYQGAIDHGYSKMQSTRMAQHQGAKLAKTTAFKTGGQYLVGKSIKTLNPEMRTRLQSLAFDYYQATGQKLKINSAFRTKAEQAALRKKYGSGAALYSIHQAGLAVDIPSRQVNKLKQLGLLSKYGLNTYVYDTKGKEPWHVEANMSAETRSRIKNALKSGQQAVKASDFMLNDPVIGGGDIAKQSAARNTIQTKTMIKENQRAQAYAANQMAASHKSNNAAMINNINNITSTMQSSHSQGGGEQKAAQFSPYAMQLLEGDLS